MQYEPYHLHYLQLLHLLEIVLYWQAQLVDNIGQKMLYVICYISFSPYRL